MTRNTSHILNLKEPTEVITSKSSRHRKRRELPQHLCPLAALVELANLISDEAVEKLRGAHRKIKDAQGELITRQSGVPGRNSETTVSVQKTLKIAAIQAQQILENFSDQVKGHRKALESLLGQMRIGDDRRPDEKSFGTLFPTVAAVRSALRTVAGNLGVPGEIVRLPEECYLPPAVLARVDGKIQVTVVPVSHWLLPLIDGLEAARLGICEACFHLYVARRRDQLGCSRRCGDTLYMRRYRRPGYRNASKPSKNAARSGARRLHLRQARD
jgi:hypothetical protein